MLATPSKRIPAARTRLPATLLALACGALATSRGRAGAPGVVGGVPATIRRDDPAWYACDPRRNPLCRGAPAEARVAAVAAEWSALMDDVIVDEASQTMRTVRRDGNVYIDLHGLCGMLDAHADAAGLDGLLAAMYRVAETRRLPLLWQHVLGAWGTDWARRSGAELHHVLEALAFTPYHEVTIHGAVFREVVGRADLHGNATRLWAHLVRQTERFASRVDYFAGMKLYHVLHGTGHGALMRFMPRSAYADACHPHEYNAWTVTAEMLRDAFALCAAAPRRTYAHECAGGVAHTHVHVAVGLPRRASLYDTSKLHRVPRIETRGVRALPHGWDTFTYMCAAAGALAPTCVRYYFIERLDLAIESFFVRRPNATYDELFAACRDRGLACVYAFPSWFFLPFVHGRLYGSLQGQVTVARLLAHLEAVCPTARDIPCVCRRLVRAGDPRADHAGWLSCVTGVAMGSAMYVHVLERLAPPAVVDDRSPLRVAAQMLALCADLHGATGDRSLDEQAAAECARTVLSSLRPDAELRYDTPLPELFDDVDAARVVAPS